MPNLLLMQVDNLTFVQIWLLFTHFFWFIALLGICLGRLGKFEIELTCFSVFLSLRRQHQKILICFFLWMALFCLGFFRGCLWWLTGLLRWGFGAFVTFFDVDLRAIDFSALNVRVVHRIISWGYLSSLLVTEEWPISIDARCCTRVGNTLSNINDWPDVLRCKGGWCEDLELGRRQVCVV